MSVAFFLLNNAKNKHTNMILFNNCEAETNRLIDVAETLRWRASQSPFSTPGN